MEKALSVLQAQRNSAMDGMANAETRAALLQDEVTKLKAQIEELQKKAEPKKE